MTEQADIRDLSGATNGETCLWENALRQQGNPGELWQRMMARSDEARAYCRDHGLFAGRDILTAILADAIRLREELAFRTAPTPPQTVAKEIRETLEEAGRVLTWIGFRGASGTCLQCGSRPTKNGC